MGMYAVGSIDRDQQTRLNAFQLTEADVALLRESARDLRELLPAVLERLHASFAPWPDIQAALKKPAVHGLRTRHWQRVAGGELAEGFMDSARTLARTLHEHAIPAFAIAICHATVTNAMIHDLRQKAGAKTKGKAGERASALRAALNKAAWLDLEALLESYGDAERDSRQETLEQIAQSFESKVLGVADKVATASRHVESAIDSISVMARRSSEASSAVASTAEQASANVQTVASASEQMAASVTEISTQVVQSTRVAGQAVGEAERTNGVVRALADGARKIGDVVNLISEIAGQTNLLALNATIEAARAGEAGKGFAVVANEVKSLATQTAQATSDIARQIGEIRTATDEAVEAIRSIASTIGEVNEITSSIAAAVEEQDVTTREITRNMHEAAAGNEQVRGAVQGIRQNAEQTLDVVNDVMGAAKELGQHSSSLNEAVRAFVKDIRAA